MDAVEFRDSGRLARPCNGSACSMVSEIHGFILRAHDHLASRIRFGLRPLIRDSNWATQALS